MGKDGGGGSKYQGITRGDGDQQGMAYTDLHLPMVGVSVDGAEVLISQDVGQAVINDIHALFGLQTTGRATEDETVLVGDDTALGHGDGATGARTQEQSTNQQQTANHSKYPF